MISPWLSWGSKFKEKKEYRGGFILTDAQLTGYNERSGLRGLMQAATVWACVNLLCDLIASLPILVMYRHSQTHKLPTSDKTLSTLLSIGPNPSMTKWVFISTILSHLLLRGNAYLWKQKDNAGRLCALWPLNPDQIVVQVDSSGKKTYTSLGLSEPMSDFEVVHIYRFSLDGYRGLSPLAYIGRYFHDELDMKENASSFLRNNATPNLLWTLEGSDPVGRKKFIEEIAGQHKGPENTGKNMAVNEKVKVQPISISPQDAQMMEARKMGSEEIARIFRVPLHLLQMPGKSSYNTAEQQSLEFLSYTVAPWCQCIEEALTAGLFSSVDRGLYTVEFSFDSLQRTDAKTRMEAYQIGRAIGLYTANEIRAKEGLPPVAGGDEVNLQIQGVGPAKPGTSPKKQENPQNNSQE